MAYFAHDTAVVDQGATIGSDSKIWHYSHIMPKAVIGDKCNIGQNVFIANNVVLGNNCKVQNNVSLYEGLTCGDNVFFGPSAVFTNVINPRCEIIRQDEYKSTVIADGVSIGANATIVCGVTLGKYCFIGAGAVVVDDVPDYALVVGNPAKQIGWMSRYGERITFGDSNEWICDKLGDIYVLKDNKVAIK